MTTLDNSEIEKIIGFEWNQLLIPKLFPQYDLELVAINYLKIIEDHIYSLVLVSGNNIKSKDHLNLLLNGNTVGGYLIKEQQEILNIINISNFFINSVRQNDFEIDQLFFKNIQEMISYRIKDLSTNTVTVDDFKIIKIILMKIENHFEKAVLILLFLINNNSVICAHVMMNTVLIFSGLESILIDQKKINEYRKKVHYFIESKNADQLVQFIYDCYPDKLGINRIEKLKLQNQLLNR